MSDALLNIISDDDAPWYSAGLQFKCTGCGKCCTGAPGYTWVTHKEIAAIADYLKLSIEEFCSKYVRRVGNRFSLLERPKNFDCIFLENKQCKIYPVRPKQCKTYPWWQQNLRSREEWQKAAEYCEGISCNAPVVPFETISAQLHIQESED